MHADNPDISPYYRESPTTSSFTEAVAFSINCFIFPAILFQMSKTWALKKNEGFTPWFILLQLLGGAPEGGVGAIIGYIEENSQMLAIGLYAMFYNAFMLFFRIFQTFLFCSTNVTCLASRDKHSIPKDPEPANKSHIFEFRKLNFISLECIIKLNIFSLTKSLNGLVV